MSRLFALACLLAVAGCSGAYEPCEDTCADGSGGQTPASGGSASGSGGLDASGGTSTDGATGGQLVTGGTPGSGGQAASGGASGGAEASGGASGGTEASGGQSTGGADGSGGAPAAMCDDDACEKGERGHYCGGDPEAPTCQTCSPGWCNCSESQTWEEGGPNGEACETAHDPSSLSCLSICT